LAVAGEMQDRWFPLYHRMMAAGHQIVAARKVGDHTFVVDHTLAVVHTLVDHNQVGCIREDLAVQLL
jgi:hypothetical protein